MDNEDRILLYNESKKEKNNYEIEWILYPLMYKLIPNKKSEDKEEVVVEIIKTVESDKKDKDDELNDIIESFLNEPFVLRDSGQKIERSGFNRFVIRYSQLKYKKSYNLAKINQIVKNKGIRESRIKGLYYLNDININYNKFTNWEKNKDKKIHRRTKSM
jgi:hypothetical protein